MTEKPKFKPLWDITRVQQEEQHGFRRPRVQVPQNYTATGPSMSHHAVGLAPGQHCSHRLLIACVFCYAQVVWPSQAAPGSPAGMGLGEGSGMWLGTQCE